jgi:hypothetical protein
LIAHDLILEPAALDDRSDAQRELDAAVIAAARLLTETVRTVTPSTSPRKLLAYLQRYRAHLSALVTAHLSIEADRVQRIASVSLDSLGS